MKRIQLFTGIASFLAITAGCHSPRADWHSPEKRAEWIVERTSKELNLNEQQRAKLNSIKNDILAKRNDFESIHSGILDEVLSEVKSETLNQEKLNKAFESREAKFKEMRSFLVSKFAEFHDMLNAEQRVKLSERLEALRKHHG